MKDLDMGKPRELSVITGYLNEEEELKRVRTSNMHCEKDCRSHSGL
jgi:hypothetical protein